MFATTYGAVSGGSSSRNAERFADAGFQLHITTNLAKRLTPPEIAAFSRFEMILVSLDSVDEALLGQLRRGARLNEILKNIEAIQRHAAATGREPQIGISVVVSDQSFAGRA